MMDALVAADDIAGIGSRLVGWTVLTAEPVRRGGNNRIYLLGGETKRAALKLYPSQREDPRDRLAQEYAALTFLHRHGVAEVPRPLACDPTARCAAFEWIDGAPPDRIGADDVDALADFFIRLQTLRNLEGAASLPDASAACFSPAMVREQLDARLQRLRRAILPGTEVADFVAASLVPAARRTSEGLPDACAAAGIAFAAPLAARLRVLSVSDFGFHNALRRTGGRLAFVDLEYFGWDDPAKAIADVMLHAGMTLPRELAQRYRARVETALQEQDHGLSFRLDLLFRSMVLLWCLILLNEFLPERWTRRALASDRDDREAAQATQLRKARDMFSRNFA